MTPSNDSTLTFLLKRDRLVVAGALALVAIASWVYILWLASTMAVDRAMEAMPGMTLMPGFVPWTGRHAAFVFAMWTVMMIGMMTPSVAPVALLYAQVARKAREQGRVFASTAWFAAGYLAAWTFFAALATSAQYLLERAALLSPAMVASSRYFGGAILVAVGVYQFTSLKRACLSQCRSPLAFIQRHGGFRPGAGSALRLGLVHGLYCLGCCSALMALLFVGGVMNVLWIAAISILVLAEKIVPGGVWLARISGALALAAGAWVLAS